MLNLKMIGTVARCVGIASAFAFTNAAHGGTYASITIIFLPHCIAVLSILPWETFRRGGKSAITQPADRSDRLADEPLQA